MAATTRGQDLTQLLTAVEKGERVTIERHGHVIAETTEPSAKKIPKFGTLKDVVRMSPEQFHAATRPMSHEERAVVDLPLNERSVGLIDSTSKAGDATAEMACRLANPKVANNAIPVPGTLIDISLPPHADRITRGCD